MMVMVSIVMTTIPMYIPMCGFSEGGFDNCSYLYIDKSDHCQDFCKWFRDKIWSSRSRRRVLRRLRECIYSSKEWTELAGLCIDSVQTDFDPL